MSRVRAALPAAIPSPTQGVWHLGPFPVARVRLVHPGRHRRRRLDRRAALAGAGRRAGHLARRRDLGGAVRRRGRPALPRDHLPSPTSGPAAARSTRSTSGRAGSGIWGAISLGASALDRLPPARRRASRCSPTPPRRASRWRRRSAGGATTSTTSCTAGPTSLPWGLKVYRWDDGAGHAVRDAAGHPIVLGELPADVPLRVAVVPGRGRGRRPARPALPARPRPGVRAVRDALHGRAGSGSSTCAVDEATPHPRPAAQRLDGPDRLRRRADLLRPGRPAGAPRSARRPRLTPTVSGSGHASAPRDEPAL